MSPTCAAGIKRAPTVSSAKPSPIWPMPSDASQPMSSPPDLSGGGERDEGHDEDHLREAGGRRHRDIVAPARDHDHQREGKGREEGQAVSRKASLAGGAEHQRDAPEREGHCPGGAPRDRLAERDPRHQGSEHGGDGRMNSTRATLVWLSAEMKLAEAVATHSATATPARPTDLNAWTTRPRSTTAT